MNTASVSVTQNQAIPKFVPIAGILTAPLSGWIITVWNWRMLFLVEGALLALMLPNKCDQSARAG